MCVSGWRCSGDGIAERRVWPPGSQSSPAHPPLGAASTTPRSGSAGRDGREPTCRRHSPNGAGPAADWGAWPAGSPPRTRPYGELRDPRPSRLPQDDVVVSTQSIARNTSCRHGSRTSPYITRADIIILILLSLLNYYKFRRYRFTVTAVRV